VKTLNVRGIRVPGFFYGTAWKEQATEELVARALAAGFRGIDTANQRKHYDEQGVGRGIKSVPREELFLQSKFTFVDGQDHRLPYDPSASIAEQVRQSFESSLEHLGTDHLDSYLLHGPSQRDGLGAADHEAWRAMEALAQAGRVTLLGVSNVTARQVQDLVALAKVPPAFVQNRCYAERLWDRAVRALCAKHDMVYQGFSLLTANQQVLAHPDVIAIAARRGKTAPQIVFRFAQQVGILPLTGTSKSAHMTQDLAIEALDLRADEIAQIEEAGVDGDRRRLPRGAQ
jgi:diketogulonate reductase-like aldo/keto reductase